MVLFYANFSNTASCIGPNNYVNDLIRVFIVSNTNFSLVCLHSIFSLSGRLVSCICLCDCFGAEYSVWF